MDGVQGPGFGLNFDHELTDVATHSVIITLGVW